MHRYLRRIRGEAVRRISRRVAKWGDLYGGDPEAQKFGAFGDETFFGYPQGVVYGQRWMSIGDRTMIGPFVSLTVGMHPEQEMVSDPALIIGDGCLIGR
ncbi:MAG: acyltransferase, partial [Acidimicrobiales bacterium]